MSTAVKNRICLSWEWSAQ